MVSRRHGAAALAQALRRQLMRDNYDYQNPRTEDERSRQRAPSKQKNGGNGSYVMRTMQVDQPNSNKLGVDKREARVRRPAHDAHDTHHTHKSSYKQDRRDAQPYYGTDMRDALGPNFTPDRRDWNDAGSTQGGHEAYDPTYGKQRRDAYDFSDGYDRRDGVNRGFSRGNAPIKQHIQVAPVANAPRDARVIKLSEQEQDIIDTQDRDDKQDNNDAQEIDVVNNNQKTGESPVRYASNQYESNFHFHGSMQRPQMEHVISKKDLLYYVDDDRLRRNNDVSADQSGANNEADEPSRRASNNNTLIKDQSIINNSSRADIATDLGMNGRRSYDAGAVSLTDSHSSDVADGMLPEVIDGLPYSAAPDTQSERTNIENVTYKILTLRAKGAGRRSGSRRFLEERQPEGVALISLDKAPFPQFRLPRARRQYMLERQDPRPPLADATARHRHKHLPLA